MSDDDLRARERRWLETREVADEVLFLEACLRTGRVTRDRLELAAYCGHQPAAVVVQAATPVAPAERTEWAKTLFARWGKEVTVRAAVAASREALRSHGPDAPIELPLRAIAAAEDWLGCPCERHSTLADLAARAATGSPAFEAMERAGGRLVDATYAAALCADAASPLGTLRPELEEWASEATWRAIVLALSAGPEDRVKAASELSLIEWALRR